MFNQVLWTLDHETDSGTFERLCADLLYRTGYRDIVPVGRMKDRGRDAEEDRRKLRILFAPSGEKTFFQFSLADRWEEKLEKELKKVHDNGHDIDVYLFVTTGEITGARRDQLKAEIKATYGWDFEARDREWLRLQLEEAHPDLAERHLGIKQPHHRAEPSSLGAQVLTGKGEAAALFNAGKYAAAAVALERWLEDHSDDAPAWRALASSQYQMRRYNEALAAAQRAAAIQPYDIGTRRVLGSILVEKGIQERARASILSGREIFEEVVRTSDLAEDLYNLANAGAALGETASARDLYLAAIERNAHLPHVWKNLGSTYEELGEVEEAIRCYDRALALNPALPEALLAKATLRIRAGAYAEGIDILERLLATNDDARVHWSAAWAWLADAYARSDKPLEALQVLGRGLTQFPNNRFMLDLKAHLLDRHWQDDAALRLEAERYFRFRMDLAPDDFRPVASLALILATLGDVERAWDLVADYLREPDTVAALRSLGPLNRERIHALHFFRSYKRFRAHTSTDDYVQLVANAGLDLTESQRARLSAALFEPYAAAREEFEEQETRDGEAFTRLVDRHVPRVRRAVSSWAESISEEIIVPPRERQAAAITAMVLSCPRIALVECSRQTGFVAGILSFDCDAATVDMPESLTNIESAMLSEVLNALNRRTKLFREDTPA